MLAKSATSHDMLETPQQQMENHPVIRTLYDHAKVYKLKVAYCANLNASGRMYYFLYALLLQIKWLEFYPYEQLLKSGI